MKDEEGLALFNDPPSVPFLRGQAVPEIESKSGGALKGAREGAQGRMVRGRLLARRRWYLGIAGMVRGLKDGSTEANRARQEVDHFGFGFGTDIARPAVVVTVDAMNE